MKNENLTLISKILDVHTNNLNNIQKNIKRMSTIGYSLLTIAISFTSIITTLIYSINISKNAKIILNSFLIISIILFFISHLINHSNEKVWIEIYNDKTKIELDDLSDKNILSKILEIDFKKYKNKSKKNIYKKCIFVWLNFIWSIIFLFSIINIILIIFNLI